MSGNEAADCRSRGEAGQSTSLREGLLGERTRVNLVYTDAKFHTVRYCNVQSVTLRKNSAVKPFWGVFAVCMLFPCSSS